VQWRTSNCDTVCGIVMEREIVVDTNVFVAAARSNRGAAFKLVSMIGKGAFAIHVSVPLVLEYEQALMEHRADSGFAVQDIDDLLDYVCAVAKPHRVFFLWRPELSDPKDDMVLEVAVVGDCDTIVTYNQRDFAGAAAFDIRVSTPGEFLADIGAL